MTDPEIAKQILQGLEEEAKATRACLERVPANLFDYAPHEKSMKMGYLALIIAEIPRWITPIVTDGEINFATFKHIEATTPEQLVAQFDQNMNDVRKVLNDVTDGSLKPTFALKAEDKTLMESPTIDSLFSTLRHGVHHRGQLTVYLRLNNIAVPSIYGPSADEQTF